ncbi:aldehyde dehydrogenase [Paraburkholderia sp. MM5384-R2]|uniref:aldehyde dehydrogenase n=1 Tax=Paraburkholderia sp. MM5384-R2 TaxID=2723097 RepID=UPI00161A22BF|nr:aldehyde dehydrogenase [Paraburkholderia sp. MM5384-R2]
MEQVSLLINGEDVFTLSVFERCQPLSGEVVSVSAAADAQHARDAADAAAHAFPLWAATLPGERRAKLLAAADCLICHMPDFVTTMMAETGATAQWAEFNVRVAADNLREAASMTTQIGGDHIPSNVPGNFAVAVRKPAGVVLGIAPWNAPVILGVRAIAMPLACGNTIILKASELCPATHRLIGRVMQEAGFAPGVVNVISHDRADAAAIVQTLIEHPAVRRVNFTGSTRVGRIVAETAARQLKPALLELGGNNPLVVLEDADLDAAVDAAAFGAFMNQGQICMSTGRVVVAEAIADEFVEKFAARARSVKCGDPRKTDALMGPLVSRDAAARIDGLIRDATNRGARVAAGGEHDGALMQATVIDRVTPDMPIYSEELFGPVATVVRVSNDDDAVRVANDTEYGLSAAVFSRDICRALAVADRIDTGICHINSSTVHDEAQMPFGGVKASGYGRFGGKEAIAEFTDVRWLTVQTSPRRYPI